MSTESDNKYPYCSGNLPYNIQEIVKKLSQDQANSFNAMHELLCSYKNPYGIGETFCLQTALESSCEFVTVEKTIGQGGSKKAVLLTDGRVAMFPNTDQDSFVGTAHWWPETVKNEAAMATFLESIEVPALNRKQAYLAIQSKSSEETSYKLPILLSDSFEQYASRGWFVFDNKCSRSTIRSDQEEWSFELNSWKNTVTPLLKDIWKLVSNNIVPGGDAHNLVLLQTDQDSFALRYFGFDFGGKYGSKTPPSLENSITTIQWNHNTCSKASKLAKDMIASFVFYRLHPEKAGYKEADDFANQVGEYFSSCDFFKTEVFGIHNSGYDEL